MGPAETLCVFYCSQHSGSGHYDTAVPSSLSRPLRCGLSVMTTRWRCNTAELQHNTLQQDPRPRECRNPTARWLCVRVLVCVCVCVCVCVYFLTVVSHTWMPRSQCMFPSWTVLPPGPQVQG